VCIWGDEEGDETKVKEEKESGVFARIVLADILRIYCLGFDE
jgi:hypothetical protein